MPSSTAPVSGSDGVPGVAVPGQIEQGQVGGGGAAAVVNDHDTGAMTLPLRSAAPLAVAVYAVLGASAADGVNVAVRLAASYPVLPGTVAPSGSLRVSDTVPACTGSLNVAVTVVL